MFIDRNIVNVQFITYDQLVKNCRLWALQLPPSRSFVGLPRSGVTVSHILSSISNHNSTQIHAPTFRQGTARERRDDDSLPWMVVDDTCSMGTAINHARNSLPDALFGAVYARPVGIEACQLDYWFRRHGDSHTLVLTEWNWCHHQDTPYVSVTEDAILHCGTLRVRPTQLFRAIYAATHRRFASCGLYKFESQNIVLTTNIKETASRYQHDERCPLLVAGKDAEELSFLSGKPVLRIQDYKLFDPTQHCWPDKIFVIGVCRTGTTSTCRALSLLGYKTKHCPVNELHLDQYEALGDIYITGNWRQLSETYPNAKWILTDRDETTWLQSVRRLQRELKNQNVRLHPNTVTACLNIHPREESTDEELIADKRKHYAEVKEHFGTKLLHYHVQEGWNPLCRYLGEPSPDLPFPEYNKQSIEHVGYHN